MIGETDTIAAISTAMNNSGIGIIRISGADAFKIIGKIFKAANKEKDVALAASHTVHYGNICDGEDVVDEVLVLIMKSPHTYTREDTVEIDCHGGMYVINKVLELAIRNGARPAQPGEFTRRAFLNGRIDLSQAEAVIDVINAENDFSLKSAVTQLKGCVSQKIREQREVLLEQIAYIEAALDDPEHIEMDGYGDVLYPVLEKIKSKIDELYRSADDGRIIKEGVKTVIIGKPNAGKSTLLNAFAGTDRAIVTQIPGTTRDILEESVRLGDITLNIIDTAGIRETEDVIEKIGVEKAKTYAEDADLILWVVDGSKPLDKDDKEIAGMIYGRKAIILINKNDLPSCVSEKQLKELLMAQNENNVRPGGGLRCSENEIDKGNQMLWPVLEISAEEKTGLEMIEKTVCHMFYNKEISFNDQVYITNARQKNELYKASVSLGRAMESIQNQMPEDFFTIDMMDAYSSLGAVIGEAIEDDLADEIFAKFCMGK